MTTTFPPITDYAFLSDCHSVVLVGRDGAVEWGCFGRLDQNPIFARILDRERGGSFRIGPSEPAEVTRRYLPDTNVLETTFRSSSGVFTVTDCLPVVPLPGRRDYGQRPPGGRRLVRLVRAIEGDPDVVLDFRPRFSFGLSTPRIELVQHDLATARGGPAALSLETDLGELRTDGASATTSARLAAGEERYVVMTHHDATEFTPIRLTARTAGDLVDETVAFWTDWVALGQYPDEFREETVRSALVLKGLANASTGAIAAGGTTSLPEELGGSRNWDYRFCWLRDSAAMISALVRVGHFDEAYAFGDWLRQTTVGRADELQIMYGMGGERLLHEATIEHLSGYENSRPVRVGNGAWDQFQLDTYGELLGAFQLVRSRIQDGPRRELESFIADVVEEVLKRYNEPDEGIWEIRGGRQHFVFSKLMAWVAIESGRALLADSDIDVDLERWTAAQDELRRQIETEGVDSEGAFTQALGSNAYDASSLLVGFFGFVPPSDPRFHATVEAVERELTVGGHVYRYAAEDGLSGEEGSFVFCTLWQARALALAGRIDEARDRLRLVLGHANDLGLLAEEIEPSSGLQLGNFPQGFSHCGVIGAAVAIEELERTGAAPTSDFRLVEQ
jgi:GH15 family glucan-1,4-alpha-glucosidase